jgi:iron complex transport system ATP-binding protein
MSPEMLATRDLHFAYSSAAPVIRGTTLALRRGTLSAVIGANGCGKSTLIRLLAGLLEPDSGEITFEGAPLASVERRLLARRIAYVPQTTARAFPFTALEVVLTGRSPHTPRFRFENARDIEKARSALATVGVESLAPRPITELSGGERQLVSVARALAQEPACLLLDEPSASLDLKHRATLLRTLCRLRDTAGLTALVVTHDLVLLDPAFDTVFAMRAGAVIAEGAPAEVLKDNTLAEIYGDPHVRALRVEGRTLVWSEI